MNSMRKLLLSTLLLTLAMACPFNVIAEEEKTLPFPDNLVIDGVPNVPTSLADEVETYSNFRYAYFQNWHPTRKEMLIQTRFGETQQIHHLLSPGAARTQLTFYKDPPQGAVFDPITGESFAFEKDKDGNENSQKYLFDMKSSKATLFSDGKSRNNAGLWSNKGDRYCYFSTRRNGEDDDAYIVSPKSPETDHLLSKCKGGEWDTLDWSPDDKTILLMQLVSLEQYNLYLVDTASGAQTALTPQDTKIVYSYGKFSKDGKGVYTTTDRDSDFQRLAYIDLKTKQHTYLTSHIHWDIETFALSWDGKTIAAIANEDGLSVLHLIDTASGKEKTAPSLPKGIISGVSWHKNNQDLAFTFESARSTADAYSLNVQTGKLERWTNSETGGINTSSLPDAKLIHWKAFDDRQLSGFLYSPPAKFGSKRPVIIEIHGGPAAQSRPEFLGRRSYFVNELGIAIIYPNVRGSTGYGKTFMGLDNTLKREDSYKDIGTLLDWIKQQPDLDADRIMITGGSYGGHMTLACSTLFSDKIRCSLDEVGQANFVTQLENTAPYGREIRRAEYGDERDPTTRAFLQKIAPVNNADKIHKPLFVVAGKNDPRVPASESEQIVRAAKANGTPVWFLMAKDEGHGFHKKKNQDYLFYAKVEFVKSFLLN